MVRVAVTGAAGMLGRRVMQAIPAAIPVEARFTGALDDPLLDELAAIDPDWVINCAGALRGEADMWIVNALLPHRIAHRWRLIQPSTDHWQDDTPYARSKRLGEAGIVIRCAVVDPEDGLLARAREGNTIGEVYRQWNGITAKTWASIAADIVAGRPTDALVTPGTPTISHYDLLETARRIFGWRTETILTYGPRWEAAAPSLMTAPIEEQLAEYL